jgi:hypothetical protein
MEETALRANARGLSGLAERKLRFRSGWGTALRAERARASPARSRGSWFAVVVNRAARRGFASPRRISSPARKPASPGLRSGLGLARRSDVDMSVVMSLAMSLAWHLSGRLQRFGEMDRSTGLTPRPGRLRHVAFYWFGHALRSFWRVASRCSGSTFTSASTGMKFVSPAQRGTTWRCTWSTMPAPAIRPRFQPRL